MNKIIKKDLSYIIKENLYRYGKYVIEDRSISSLYDGLKPVHRRALFAAYKGNFNRLSKGAKLVGEVLGCYHP